MTSRERVLAAIHHQTPDRVPLDLGAGPTSGMAVSSVHKLKVALGLSGPDEPVKVTEPFQMLGEIDASLRDALGVDVVGLGGRRNFFGFASDRWKEWRLFDGTPVLVPEKFNTQPDANGDIRQYPEGDTSLEPCARMPRGGFYFDSIIRQPPIDEANLRVEDNLEEFAVLSAEVLAYFRSEADRLRAETDAAIMMVGPGMAFGDIAHVPGTSLRRPKGIRDIEEWYVSLVMRREHIREIFRRQCDIALENLRLMWDALGDRIDIVYLSGTDFGTQASPFLSPKDYCDLFQPFQRRLNDWIHANTSWSTFQHSCGAVEPLVGHFIDAGFDILNPVQTSACGMDPRELKEKFGPRLTFWGGGVDTQHVLPFGTPDEVRAQVRERIDIFSPGGGFVFNTIHNVQAGVPVDNLIALYETVNECR